MDTDMGYTSGEFQGSSAILMNYSVSIDSENENGKASRITPAAPGLPYLLRRPLPRPLQSDEGVASRSCFRRLDFDQVLNLEPATPEQSEPVAVGQLELDTRFV